MQNYKLYMFNNDIEHIYPNTNTNTNTNTNINTNMNQNNYMCSYNILLFIIAKQISHYIHIIPANYCSHKYNTLIIFALIALYLPLIMSFISLYVSFIENLCDFVINLYDDVKYDLEVKNLYMNNDKKIHVHFNTCNNIETNLEQSVGEGYPIH